MRLIPQAASYKLALPTSKQLAGHIENFLFSPILPHMPRAVGFVDTYGELVKDFPGGCAFTVRIDEKVIPPSLIKVELEKKIEQFRDRNGYPPLRKVKNELKDEVIGELTLKALSKTKLVTVYYHADSETFLIPVASQKLRDEITGLLLRAVESIKATTIYVSTAKASLTTRLEATLEGIDDQFDDFTAGGKVVLVGEAGKSTFDLCGDLDNASAGIREAIAAGAQVKEIALADGETTFRLTQDFFLKGIRFEEVEQDEDTGDLEPGEVFANEAAVQVLSTVRLVEKLCTLFGYKPGDEDAEDLM